jgi:hypothetical protein
MSKLKIVIPAILLLVVIFAKAQPMQKDSLVGAWVCVEATVPNDLKIPREEMESLKVLKPAIIDSKFVFKSNGLLAWQFPNSVPPVFQGVDFLNNQKWSIDAKMNLIHIEDPKENLMQITAHEKTGIVYFILSDIPLLLRMKKEKVK